MEYISDLGDYLSKRLSSYLLVSSYEKGCLIIKVEEKALYNILSFLQHDTYCQFEQLVDLVVLDQPDQEERFKLIYILQSFKENKRIHIVTHTNSEASSIVEIYKSAAWLEREAWEMFGVFFKNNKDLRNLLTDHLLVGNPLRKDFPVSGFSDLVFDASDNNFSFTPLSLLQEHRLFNLENPWKGPNLFQKTSENNEEALEIIEEVLDES
ncbi:NADH-quinone oxidoreductase subunit C [Alphaproteobacteria bacterium]|nr:NADH-quinone oxidoreductase subunit C [Alphaproteobacteria bacterium]